MPFQCPNNTVPFEKQLQNLPNNQLSEKTAMKLIDTVGKKGTVRIIYAS
jgi:hypothetical protein